MNKSRVAILLTGWGILFVVSMVHIWLTEPTGDSFTRGLNRVAIAFTWQVVTIAIAMAAFVMGRRGKEHLSRRMRTLAALPLIVHALIILIVIGLIVAAIMNSPNG